MRAARMFLIAVALVFTGLLTPTNSASAGLSESETRLSTLEVSYWVDSDHKLLPVRGIDLPVVTAIDAKSESRSALKTTPVEAIPSPTSFQVGAILLAFILAWRIARKIRLA